MVANADNTHTNIDHFNMNWNYPTDIRLGVNRVSELGNIAKSLQMLNPLVVTDPGIAQLPMFKQALRQANTIIRTDVFSDIKANPTGNNVEAGVNAFKKGKHDGVIAFGGGSAIDAGKAIALMVGQALPLWDFEDIGDNYLKVNSQSMVNVIAVPTTSGTGAEVGRASVITDTRISNDHIKRIIFHPNMMPSAVILDPALTIDLPEKITAATGMDALSHALEAYCSPSYHPMATGIAIEAISLIKEHLIAATHDGKNLNARAHVMAAATMGATAFQKGLGAMHALAHPIGALYDSHHGLINAIVMPYVLKANATEISDKISKLCCYLSIEKADLAGFINWALSLRQALNIPHTLADIGITEEYAEKIGKMAVNDPSASGNPIHLTAEQYSQIFKNAVKGNL